MFNGENKNVFHNVRKSNFFIDQQDPDMAEKVVLRGET